MDPSPERGYSSALLGSMSDAMQLFGLARPESVEEEPERGEARDWALAKKL
jgi:hypothetical protein